MIKSLLIGNNLAVDRYTDLLSKSSYFGDKQVHIIEGTEAQIENLAIEPYDAIFFLSPSIQAFQYFTEIFKAQKSLYFVDQPVLKAHELAQLEKTQVESGCLVFAEKIELEHPLVDEFLTTNGRHLLFRYIKSIQGKKNIRQALFSALCFLSVLSPMQVKKIDVNTIDTTSDDKPIIKIRLKMFDSSLCFIHLKLDNKTEHAMLIETNVGNFSFNFTENYLENVHGKRFSSLALSDDDLMLKSINSFAMNIILNKKPNFTFRNYVLVANNLTHIETILHNSF
jgi:hypothetical protein